MENSIAAVDQISAWLVYQQDWQQLKILLSAVDDNRAELAGNMKAKFDVYHAQLAIAENKFGLAKERLKQALNNDPSHGEALLSLATLLWQQTRNESGI